MLRELVFFQNRVNDTPAPTGMSMILLRLRRVADFSAKELGKRKAAKWRLVLGTTYPKIAGPFSPHN